MTINYNIYQKGENYLIKKIITLSKNINFSYYIREFHAKKNGTKEIFFATFLLSVFHILFFLTWQPGMIILGVIQMIALLVIIEDCNLIFYKKSYSFYSEALRYITNIKDHEKEKKKKKKEKKEKTQDKLILKTIVTKDKIFEGESLKRKIVFEKLSNEKKI